MKNIRQIRSKETITNPYTCRWTGFLSQTIPMRFHSNAAARLNVLTPWFAILKREASLAACRRIGLPLGTARAASFVRARNVRDFSSTALAIVWPTTDLSSMDSICVLRASAITSCRVALEVQHSPPIAAAGGPPRE